MKTFRGLFFHGYNGRPTGATSFVLKCLLVPDSYILKQFSATGILGGAVTAREYRNVFCKTYFRFFLMQAFTRARFMYERIQDDCRILGRS